MQLLFNNGTAFNDSFSPSNHILNLTSFIYIYGQVLAIQLHIQVLDLNCGLENRCPNSSVFHMFPCFFQAYSGIAC